MKRAVEVGRTQLAGLDGIKDIYEERNEHLPQSM
jgi:hypothetical protein